MKPLFVTFIILLSFNISKAGESGKSSNYPCSDLVSEAVNDAVKQDTNQNRDFIKRSLEWQRTLGRATIQLSQESLSLVKKSRNRHGDWELELAGRHSITTKFKYARHLNRENPEDRSQIREYSFKVLVSLEPDNSCSARVVEHILTYLEPMSEPLVGIATETESSSP